jgi:hypothetical protein
MRRRSAGVLFYVSPMGLVVCLGALAFSWFLIGVLVLSLAQHEFAVYTAASTSKKREFVRSFSFT